MTELEQIFNKYKCDKGTLDKGHHYYRVYEKELEHMRNDPIKILEVGIWKGTSFDAWHEYFPNAEIYGIDIFTRLQPTDVPALKKDRIHWLKGDSTHPDIARKIAKEWGSVTFDVIIDDGKHTPLANTKTFNNLFQFLKEGGTYFVEDVWPLDLMETEGNSHEWVKRNPEKYNMLAFHQFRNAIQNQIVEQFDLRAASGLSDSYIYKITHN